MAYDLTGKVKLVMDAKTISDKFTVREFVVTVEDGNYPQDIALQFVNDKVSLLDNVQVGQEVTVSFDILVPDSSVGGGNIYVGGNHGGGGFARETDRGPQLGWFADGLIRRPPGEIVKLTMKDLDPTGKDARPYVYCYRLVDPNFEAVKQAYLTDDEPLPSDMQIVQIWVEGDNFAITDAYYAGGIKF